MGADERLESSPVGVGRKAVHLDHLGAKVHLASVDAHPSLALEDASSQRMVCLVADEQDHVAGVLPVMEQVVQDPAVLAHPAGGDDDGRAVQGVELPGFLGLARVPQHVESERVPGLPGAGFVALRVAPVDVGHVGGQRAVDEDGNFGEPLRELLEAVGQVLGPPHGEGGDEDLSLPLEHAPDQRLDLLLLVHLGFMVPVAVRGLDDHRVGVGEELRLAQDGQGVTPEIAGEDERPVVGLETDHRGAEHVAGIVERKVHAVGDLDRVAVGDRLEEIGRLPRILDGVGGFELSLLPSIDLLDVPLLDVGGVLEHHGGQVGGGGRGEDRAVIPGADEGGQGTGVVDVGMGEDDGVDVLRLEPQVPVSTEAFLAPALEEAAVEKDPGTADLDDVAAPGHAAGRAVKGELHGGGHYIRWRYTCPDPGVKRWANLQDRA